MITSPDPVERECAVFARHLAGVEPDERIRAAWRRAHECGAALPPGGASAFDRASVAFARGGTTCALLADAYCLVCARRGLLRRKLVLLLAILETSRATHRALDRPDPGSAAGFLARAALLALRTAAAALAGAILLLPVQLACALVGRRAAPEAGS